MRNKYNAQRCESGSMKETIVRNSICSWLRLQKAFVFVHDSVGIYDPIKRRFRKNHNPYRIKGVSDILGIWRNKFLAIEVKNEKGRASPEQKQFIARVNEYGGIGFVARSIDDCERELRLRGEF